jgi:hypothetical protein
MFEDSTKNYNQPCSITIISQTNASLRQHEMQGQLNDERQKIPTNSTIITISINKDINNCKCFKYLLMVVIFIISAIDVVFIVTII